MDTVTYEAELRKCPKRAVRPAEFRAAASAAQWEDQSIACMLKPPYFEGYVKVGKEALLIVADDQWRTK